MTKAEFDARMPVEFWREVVDRVAAEVPGTLLLAEAFWLLEGYFVRTLGMHRVYNSAFMHMLRDEDNAGYRKVIRDTLEFDPEILKRYVNFMSNPDEKTAVEQFGKGDKYFGVATVLATLPGPADARPRPGRGLRREVRHGVPAGDRSTSSPIRGWSSATSARSSRCSTGGPGSPRRATSCCTTSSTDGGGVDENVFAYSNGSGRERSLVVYHNRFGVDARARSASPSPYARQVGDGAKRLVRRTLAEGLGPARRPGGVRRVPRRPDRASSTCARRREIRERGLASRSTPTGPRLLGVPRGPRRRRRSVAPARRRGSAARGVPSLDEAMRELQLEPVHAPLRAVFDDGLTVAVSTACEPASSPTSRADRRVPASHRRGDRRHRRRARSPPGSGRGRRSSWMARRRPRDRPEA